MNKKTVKQVGMSIDKKTVKQIGIRRYKKRRLNKKGRETGGNEYRQEEKIDKEDSETDGNK